MDIFRNLDIFVTIAINTAPSYLCSYISCYSRFMYIDVTVHMKYWYPCTQGEPPTRNDLIQSMDIESLWCWKHHLSHCFLFNHLTDSRPDDLVFVWLLLFLLILNLFFVFLVSYLKYCISFLSGDKWSKADNLLWTTQTVADDPAAAADVHVGPGAIPHTSLMS